MRNVIKVVLLILLVVGCSEQSNNSSITTPNKKIVTVELNKDYSGWQGVAADNENIYISSDRDENFELNNSISVYSLDGELKNIVTDAYKGSDSKGRFMSFGDINNIDDKLFVTAYNFNSGGGNEPESHILVFNKDLTLESKYDIGDGIAESVVENRGYFWVVYHDRKEIRRFDKNFKDYQSYELGQDFEKEGGYQGIVFNGDDLYVNLHGSNEFNQEYAFGLDYYKFGNEKFTFVERIKPPTYGAGQGIEYYDGKVFWADRPSNTIVITDKFDIWD